MVEVNHCPTCRGELLPESLAGLCPRCLMGLALVDPDRPDEPAAEGPAIGGGLEVIEEIARGGMGVILRAVDSEFGREVAVKVLQDRYCDHETMVRRFDQEARLAGRLQHPGIVPVFAIGTFHDGRPYYTMRLVRGRTLAEILADRASPSQGRDELLSIFLKVAQAAAYAHSRDVIHRDLTPANVMVGEYGEVQVMDWGVASVLPRGGDGSGGRPVSAPFVGTPGYIAPEQFGPDPVALDERTDVFALGSILCEILTGQSAYHAPSSREALEKSRRIDLGEALALLDASGANPELVALARDCLAVDPSRRPRDAGAVATWLADHLNRAGERLREADLARAEAKARASEERKRRRLTALLAALVLALGVVGIGVYASWVRRRHEREAALAVVLREVEIFREEADLDPTGDPAHWVAARDVLRRSRMSLDRDDHSPVQAQFDGAVGQVERRLAAAEADRRLLGRLDTARALADDNALAEADALFESAFHDAGLDVAHGDPAVIGREVANRPRAVMQAVVAALDCWAIVRREREGVGHRDAGPWRAPFAVARAADLDPWRTALRNTLMTKDRDALARLAQADDLERRPAPSLWLLGRLLVWDDQTVRARTALARARRAHPDDFWINFDLSRAWSFGGSRRNDMSLLYATTAMALRPGSAMARLHLAEALQEVGDLQAAEAELREALRLAPDYDYAHFILAKLLAAAGRSVEAVAEFRAAIRLKPRYVDDLRLALAETLIRRGPVADDEARSLYDLGLIRLRNDDEVGALEALSRAAALAGSASSDFAEIAAAKEQAAQLGRLRAIVRGADKARDNDERRALIAVAQRHGWMAAAARLYAEALEADPDLARRQSVYHRVAAARFAVAAGTGPTRDDPAPSLETKARLRRLALTWLRADLDDWSRRFAPDRPETRRRAAESFQQWQKDVRLAGVRDPAAIDALPADERDAWKTFWSDLSAQIRAAQAEPDRSQIPR